MKIYRGKRSLKGNQVFVSQTYDSGEQRRELDPRFDLCNHSPTGFEWGYGGSGPAQLALAILADYFCDDDKAQVFYQDFKFKVIGELRCDEWTLTSDQIDSAISKLKPKESPMDEYGTYRATREDWDELAALFKEKENILFPYSADAQRAMIVSINRDYQVSGKMPFGGNSDGRAWVSVWGRGACHVDIDSEQYPSYLEEHLGLPKDNAFQLAELLNELRIRRL